MAPFLIKRAIGVAKPSVRSGERLVRGCKQFLPSPAWLLFCKTYIPFLRPLYTYYVVHTWSAWSQVPVSLQYACMVAVIGTTCAMPLFAKCNECRKTSLLVGTKVSCICRKPQVHSKAKSFSNRRFPFCKLSYAPLEAGIIKGFICVGQKQKWGLIGLIDFHRTLTNCPWSLRTNWKGKHSAKFEHDSPPFLSPPLPVHHPSIHPSFTWVTESASS